MSWFHKVATAGVFVASTAWVGAAGAHVRHEGVWPGADKLVTLDVTGAPRGEALRKLADAAGWSVVVRDVGGEPVDVHVKQAPASKVLDLLLDDGDFVAKREGNLVSIDASGAAAPSTSRASTPGVPAVPALPPIAPIPPLPPVPPLPPLAGAGTTSHGPGSIHIQIGEDSDDDADDDDDKPASKDRGEDRTVMGGDVRIAKGERAREVTVFGGNVDIEGDATGDVTVFGGSVRVHDGARVRGDASVFGGTLTLDSGARVDGDVNAIGGTLDRDPGSKVGGEVTTKGGKSGGHAKEGASFLARAGRSVMDAVRLGAVLFVIGTMMLALAGRRMDALRVEAAARPMRSIALGVLGSIGALLVLVALCVTIIGIPIAFVALVVGGFGALAAMCAVLSVVGEALVRHKTENPYVHLGVGCALFVTLTLVPWVGGLVAAATWLAGIGVLVATRGAGWVPRKGGTSATPYRTAAEG